MYERRLLGSTVKKIESWRLKILLAFGTNQMYERRLPGSTVPKNRVLESRNPTLVLVRTMEAYREEEVHKRGRDRFTVQTLVGAIDPYDSIEHYVFPCHRVFSSFRIRLD